MMSAARVQPGEGAEGGQRDPGASTRRARSDACITWQSTGRPSTTTGCAQAFRLIPDRQALINVAIAGFGTPGNDLFGKGCPYFAEVCPSAQQDLEKAKSLLKAAGKTTSTVTLQTSNVVPGFVEAATLFAQQAKAAGVKVKIKKEPANAYFDTSLLYTKLTFGAVLLGGRLARRVVQLALHSKAVWNETHWRDTVVRQADRARPRRAERAVAQASVWFERAEDPVRRGWLHHLDKPEHRRRRLEQGEGHRAELVHEPRRLGLQGVLAEHVQGSGPSVAAPSQATGRRRP